MELNTCQLVFQIFIIFYYFPLQDVWPQALDGNKT